MTTAIDTNILLDLLIPNEAFYNASAAALEASAAGLMRQCPPAPRAGRNVTSGTPRPRSPSGPR